MGYRRQVVTTNAWLSPGWPLITNNVILLTKVLLEFFIWVNKKSAICIEMSNTFKQYVNNIAYIKANKLTLCP